jgi:hypothetical protein
MSITATAAESFTDVLLEATRRNVENTLGACDSFRQWHRENFVLKQPTAEQVAEHATDLRILLLTLRWLEATLADPASPVRGLLPRVETMVKLLEDCWQYVHEPLPAGEAEKILADVFPE